jgi:hypothetical protein
MKKCKSLVWTFFCNLGRQCKVENTEAEEYREESKGQDYCTKTFASYLRK